MWSIYFVLKWLHIGSICIAFGSNVTHIFWIIAANRDPVHRANILRLVKKIDDRLSVPAWVIATICGATMWLWQWPVNSSWVIVSLVLTVILTAMGISFGPFMIKWINLAKNTSPDNQPLLTLSRRLTIWWISISLTVFVILYLMVFKPILW
ncbi:MAG: DUF2269 family protein [Gammaproteobacteria bacterium]|jgi:uncharacterized membrane protein|nr:DUF2269 family protein [Gammaproteobacteria bacterium]